MTKKIRFQTLDRGTGIPVAKRKPLVKTIDVSPKVSVPVVPAPSIPTVSTVASVTTVTTKVDSLAQPSVVEKPIEKPIVKAQKKIDKEPATQPLSSPVDLEERTVFLQTKLERSFWWVSAICLDFVFVGISILSLVIVPRMIGLQSLGIFSEFSFWLAKINVWELLVLGYCSFVLYWLTFKWLVGETLGSMLFAGSHKI